MDPAVVLGDCEDCGMKVLFKCCDCHIALLRPNEEHECAVGDDGWPISYALCAGCEMERMESAMDPVVVLGECEDCGVDVHFRCSDCHLAILRPHEEHDCVVENDGWHMFYALCAGCKDERMAMEEELQGLFADDDEGYESGADEDFEAEP